MRYCITFVVFLLYYICPIRAQCVSGNCHTGSGIYKFKSGALFEGEFKNNKMAKGNYFYVNGDIYKGEFLASKRHGKGEYFYNDGRYFIGSYLKGSKLEGKFKYANGATYHGDFHKGKRHGKGRYVNEYGKVTEGLWYDNKFVGKSESNTIDTYILIVGINDYEFISNLKYTLEDAQAFEKMALKGTLGQVSENAIIALYDEFATKKSILEAMSSLYSKADENDKVIFYFSGHGASGIFCASDSRRGGFLYHSEIKEQFSKCRASTKLIIADACYAGSLLNSDQQKMKKSFNATLSQKLQVAVFMSCRDNETSLEDPKLGHGVFTYYLLESFTEAGDANNDGMITIAEMFYYVRNNTYSHCHNIYNHKQCPTLVGQFDRSNVICYL